MPRAGSTANDRRHQREQRNGVSGQGRRRARQPVQRTRRVEFTLTGEEYAILVEAQPGGRGWPAERTPPRQR